MTDAALPICEFPGCGKVFDTARGLASHLKSHAESVECPKCGKTVRYLVPHLRTVHDLHDDAESALIEALRGLIDEVRELRKENRELRAQIEERQL